MSIIFQIDLDTIDTSNLNRQFLFQKRHVGQSKSKVARETALEFVPTSNIEAIHDSITRYYLTEQNLNLLLTFEYRACLAWIKPWMPWKSISMGVSFIQVNCIRYLYQWNTVIIVYSRFQCQWTTNDSDTEHAWGKTESSIAFAATSCVRDLTRQNGLITILLALS